MENAKDPRKQTLVFNFINFLQDELETSNLNDERKESVEVAIQCLETAFELNNSNGDCCEKIDLLPLMPDTSKENVSEDAKAEAEEHKNMGNVHMRNNEYSNAIDEYTKAITKNPHNAVYYCNRAAAYSRLEKHMESIIDCKMAIKLDRTYSKAYSRLGIAYANINKFEEAREAYLTALQYDPNNPVYEQNLRLAEERICSNMDSAAPQPNQLLDMSQFINNPNLINMATQMLSDANIRNLMSGILTSNHSTEPNIDLLVQAGQQLASQMETTQPEFLDNLRRTLDLRNFPAPANSTANADNNPNSSINDAPPQPPSDEQNDKPNNSQS